MAGPRLTPLQAMQLAIEEGRKGWGFTRPNPNVGCVILDREGYLLASGYHARFGGLHAEANAFSKVLGSDAGVVSEAALHGAQVYVTLEPCAHEGKTPSCAKALAKLPLGEVVYGLIDPHEKVAGKGLEILRAAGIGVNSIIEVLRENDTSSEMLARLEADLEELCEHFLWNHRKHLPFVALKVATTQDGMMAPETGKSGWITGEEALTEVHRLRAGFAAVLVGKNSFLTDNPLLNVRHANYVGHMNKVIVLDSRGEALAKLIGSNIWKTHRPEDIYWVVAPSFCAEVAGGETKLDEIVRSVTSLGIKLVNGPIEAALSELYRRGIDSIFVEGGAKVANYFLRHGLVNRLYHFASPKVSGVGGMGWASGVKLNLDMKLQDVKVAQFGSDKMVTGRLR